MKEIGFAALLVGALLASALPARADMVGAAAGAGTGLVVAGPIGALAGALVGGFYGRPFWGPPIGRRACWIDNHFHRHCR